MLSILSNAQLRAALAPWFAAGLLAGCAAQPAVVEPVAVEPPGAAVAETPPVAEPEAEPVLETRAEAAGEVAVVPPQPPPRPAWQRDDVLWIQQRLQDLGYYDGAIDGAPGPATRQAIRDYQKDQDVTADGQPSPALREFMWRNGG